ncbi:PaaI family thioesterase [Vibrio sp. HA2012]|uniref:PaaI family thioesterase n=1 Tax=Vibrio sp. HA2012 TaxID=1971595 RepID=UPI000C2C58AF|nr:PaaI family thioesterase [Vibrio sp. HA2012]PJC86713.1 PaaI family thioesterase [Vibrio sp. HA2012]
MDDYYAMKQSHKGCMVCGLSEFNSDSLQLAFNCDSENRVTTRFLVTEQHQGYTGLLHGGMTSTLLDAAMTHCLFSHGIQALTAELVVRFIAPIPLGAELVVSAELTGKRRGIYQLEGMITHGQRLLARATSKFIQPKEKM